MSAGLPKRIDARRQAESGRHLEGELKTGDCPRLEQAVLGVEGPIVVSVDIRKPSGGRTIIEGNVIARVWMQCQRCLEPIAIQLDSDLSLGVVFDEEEAELLPDELDPLIVEDEIRLHEVVEDELLLALPIVALHDDCEPPAATSSGQEQDTGLPERDNPFAVLASLKKSDK